MLSRCQQPELLRVELAALAADGSFASAQNNNRAGLLERVRLAKGLTLSTDDWPEHVVSRTVGQWMAAPSTPSGASSA